MTDFMVEIPAGNGQFHPALRVRALTRLDAMTKARDWLGLPSSYSVMGSRVRRCSTPKGA